MNAHQLAGSSKALVLRGTSALVPTVRRVQTRPPVPSATPLYAEAMTQTGVDPVRVLQEITTGLAEYGQLITATFQGAEE